VSDWIVMDAKDGKFKCKSCGDENQVKMPLLLTEFVAQCRAFEKRHKGCKPPAKSAGGDRS